MSDTNQQNENGTKGFRTLIIAIAIIIGATSIRIKPANNGHKERDIIKYERYHPNENSYVYIVDKDYISYIDIDTKHKDYIMVNKVCYKNGKVYAKECFNKKFTKIDENEYENNDTTIITDNLSIDIDYIDSDNSTYTYSRIGNISIDITDKDINKYLHSKNSIGDLININATYKSTTMSNKELYNIFEANDGTEFYVAASQSDPNFIKGNYVRIIGSLYKINDDDIPVLHSLTITILK